MVNNTENRITDEEIERIVNVVLNKVNDIFYYPTS